MASRRSRAAGAVGRRRLRALAASLSTTLLLVACSPTRTVDRPASEPAGSSATVTLVAAGDIACGPDIEGWYSFDAGAWHVVVLNSECEEVGCDADSDQGEWLAADLAANSARCTLAAFHRPRFSSGDEWGDDESVSGFWQVLQDAGVDVVVNGHEHSYERFAPQRDSKRPTAEEGMAEFVVGTGGRNLRGFGDPKPNSEVRWNESFGVLGLTLRPDGYDWRFHGTDGNDQVDRGSASCR